MGMQAPEEFLVLDIETTLDHNTIHGAGLYSSSTQSAVWVSTADELTRAVGEIGRAHV